MWRWIKRALIVAVMIVVVFGVVFTLWAIGGPKPGAAAQSALENGQGVTVSVGDVVTFTPSAPTNIGFIFYPGARMEPESYAPVLQKIAAAGVVVVASDMPLNLAVFDADAAAHIRSGHPEISEWAIGGHSLGGAMAAQFLSGDELPWNDLILWASYPPSGADLTGYGGEVVSIYGSRDGVATPQEVLDAAPLLPVSTSFVEIEGGNHAQFGDYGPQKGDMDATISAQEQWDAVAQATIDVLK